jgi:hypothetical protein
MQSFPLTYCIIKDQNSVDNHNMQSETLLICKYCVYEDRMFDNLDHLKCLNSHINAHLAMRAKIQKKSHESVLLSTVYVNLIWTPAVEMEWCLARL